MIATKVFSYFLNLNLEITLIFALTCKQISGWLAKKKSVVRDHQLEIPSIKWSYAIIGAEKNQKMIKLLDIAFGNPCKK